MSDPVVELPEVMMAEMMKGTEKRSASQTTVSTLATSASMLSMATAVDEADLSGDITEVNLPQGDGQRRILRVRTLNESLSIPDISHGVERRSVGFDTLEIREYGIILGWYVTHDTGNIDYVTFCDGIDRPLTNENLSLSLRIMNFHPQQSRRECGCSDYHRLEIPINVRV
jgi:hypothetical protein